MCELYVQKEGQGFSPLDEARVSGDAKIVKCQNNGGTLVLNEAQTVLSARALNLLKKKFTAELGAAPRSGTAVRTPSAPQIWIDQDAMFDSPASANVYTEQEFDIGMPNLWDVSEDLAGLNPVRPTEEARLSLSSVTGGGPQWNEYQPAPVMDQCHIDFFKALGLPVLTSGAASGFPANKAGSNDVDMESAEPEAIQENKVKGKVLPLIKSDKMLPVNLVPAIFGTPLQPVMPRVAPSLAVQLPAPARPVAMEVKETKSEAVADEQRIFVKPKRKRGRPSKRQLAMEAAALLPKVLAKNPTKYDSDEMLCTGGDDADKLALLLVKAFDKGVQLNTMAYLPTPDAI